MIIIGQTPKSLDDLKPLGVDEIKAFVQGMDNFVKSETPLEIPVGVSGNDLGRLTVTLRDALTFIEKVAHAEAGIESPGTAALIEKWNGLQEEARSWITVKPRLILPK